MRLQEPHILLPALLEKVCERKRIVRLLEPHILSSLLWEMLRERKGECAALRAAHYLSFLV